MISQGIVISVHQLGATVRLEDGTLATLSSAELAANRPTFVRSLKQRQPLSFTLERSGRRSMVRLAAAPSPIDAQTPNLVDAVFESHMNAYLKSVEEWSPPDRPPPAERHFIRKKRRAAFFEARSKGS
jgi:hypothetical protein